VVFGALTGATENARHENAAP